MTDYYPNPNPDQAPNPNPVPAPPSGQAWPGNPGPGAAGQGGYPQAGYPAAGWPQAPGYPQGQPTWPAQPAATGEYPVWSAENYRPSTAPGAPAGEGGAPAASAPPFPGSADATAWIPAVGGYPQGAGGYLPPLPPPSSRRSPGWKAGVAVAAAGGLLVAAAAGFGIGVLVTGNPSDDAAVRVTGDGLPQAPSGTDSGGQAQGDTNTLPQPDTGGAQPGTGTLPGTDEGSSGDTDTPDSSGDSQGQIPQGDSGDNGFTIPGIPGFGPGTGSQGGSSQSEQLSDTAAAAAEKVTPSVVNIDVTIGYGAGAGAGTGIVLTTDGKVLTNAHVISGASSIKGTVVGNSKTYPITVLGYDKTRDVALVQLEGASGLTAAEVDDSSKVTTGELVVGVGNAGGDGGEPTSVEGQVTETGATITASDAMGGDSETLHDLIGTDANIQAGQSGGPMVDGDGQVIGMNTAASTGGGFSQAGQSTGYAIPINDALQIANQINDGKSSDTVHIGQTAFLGVQVAQGSGQGVAVAGAVAGSAAAKAGLGSGDTILSIDGKAVNSPEALSATIRDHKVGDTVTVVYTDSSGARKTVTVTLGAGPAA